MIEIELRDRMILVKKRDANTQEEMQSFYIVFAKNDVDNLEVIEAVLKKQNIKIDDVEKFIRKISNNYELDTEKTFEALTEDGKQVLSFRFFNKPCYNIKSNK